MLDFYLLVTDDLYSIMLTTGHLYNTVLTQVICKTVCKKWQVYPTDAFPPYGSPSSRS